MNQLHKHVGVCRILDGSRTHDLADSGAEARIGSFLSTGEGASCGGDKAQYDCEYDGEAGLGTQSVRSSTKSAAKHTDEAWALRAQALVGRMNLQILPISETQHLVASAQLGLEDNLLAAAVRQRFLSRHRKRGLVEPDCDGAAHRHLLEARTARP